MNISKAIDQARQGKKIAHGSWSNGHPSYLVFVPGREVEASFPPMVNHLGEGTKFLVSDHVDAVYKGMIQTHSVLGYQFSQIEILEDRWFLVD
ncbi:hypothetical protein Q669_29695 [Labrenzia sp. C1B10]|nr:hypothetical protein Q669_29695 [Labrenzia sp. C1B10]